MEKNKALKLLKEYLPQTTQLKYLHYDNPEFFLWRDKVSDVLEASFGLQSKEYERFSRARLITFGGSNPQQDYLTELGMNETALKSIIQKYEILGNELEAENISNMSPLQNKLESKRKEKIIINDTNKPNSADELRNFYKKLKSYQTRQLNKVKNGSSIAKDRSLNALRLELQREYGRFGNIISNHKSCRIIPYSEDMQVIFSVAFSSLNMDGNAFSSLEIALGIINTAVGVFESPNTSTDNILMQKSEQLQIDSLFESLKFHPKLIDVSKNLFKTGNYDSAIFEAFKAVNNYVKEKTGLTLDGTNLMEKVFNENKPILKMNDLLNPSDKNEQTGFKHLFIGSQMGIRNPRSHENVKQEDPIITLHYLGIASLLMKRIDQAKLVKLNIQE